MVSKNSKWKGAYNIGRKYNKDWESKSSWVTKALDNSEDAFCKLCHAVMKHKKVINRCSASNFLPLQSQVVHAPKIADEVKATEIELAVTMACHSAILAMDHLGEVIACNAQTNVVSPALNEELIVDVQGKKVLNCQ